MEKKKSIKKRSSSLVAQYVRVYLANQRRGTASTKTRGDVSGGGRKPWRQKGTGRARQGSTRSPIWVKGGVSHGPKSRDWGLKMPQKMRQQALATSIEIAKAEKRLLNLEAPILNKISSKVLSLWLKEQKVKGTTLLVLPSFEDLWKKVFLSARNLTGVTVSREADLNAYDVTKAKTVIWLKGAEELKSKPPSKRKIAKTK